MKETTAEYDSCGIATVLSKRAFPTNQIIETCLNALKIMNHRAGFTDGEGDGCGMMIDIPRKLWQEKLGEQSRYALDPHFASAHLFIQSPVYEPIKAEILSKCEQNGFAVLYNSDRKTDAAVLGKNGKAAEPVFLQLGLLYQGTDDLNRSLYTLKIALETNPLVHAASLSASIAVYKVMGTVDVLKEYYQDLKSPLIESTVALGHNRYSTNTASSFFRVQPFSLLGHNGEMNTIEKLRKEARLLGIELSNGGSDSQDLDRVLDAFTSKYGYSLFASMDVLFPPTINEMKKLPKALCDMYTYIREAWGHFAQGPAAIISRYGDETVFSVDALGLRPLWLLETRGEYLFSSEQGIIDCGQMIKSPKPLSPGEKVGIRYENGAARLYLMNDYQEVVYRELKDKLDMIDRSSDLEFPVLSMNKEQPALSEEKLAFFGWDAETAEDIRAMSLTGKEAVSSLGNDKPLTALRKGIRNVSDFLLESVAVVTNPAIDREREIEHFSLRTNIGARPPLFEKTVSGHMLQLPSPLIVNLPSLLTRVDAYTILSVSQAEGETVREALARITEAAVQTVQNGSCLVVLTDYKEPDRYLDLTLALSSADKALQEAGLRRMASLAVHSASLRSLHDIIVSLGLGADLVCPYALFSMAEDEEKVYKALNEGIEKVISTMGTHEVRGYGPSFSAIGLHEEIRAVLGIKNFCAGDFGFKALETDAILRKTEQKLTKPYRMLPRVRRLVKALCETGDIEAYSKGLQALEEAVPVSLRHLLTFRNRETGSLPSPSIGGQAYPFFISSMSFGSQSETAYRAYIEAASRLGIIALNGEGGEIASIAGKYPANRGIQVASGRFGVTVGLLNSACLIEIKIGQGAKPGEGGFLPGSKVTEKIARARYATPGHDLISPSNNHDIYSIEDLAQMITELKSANGEARISVKVPIVPNIGTIAVGIAKAGADIISLSGFDGGTGAARRHAIHYVGLPVEIGVKESHEALIAAGMRSKVEIWADGGMKSAEDVIKVMLLGANRIGFGTLAMLAIGCSVCRSCYLGNCAFGITAQWDKNLNFETAVANLYTLFTAFGTQVGKVASSLGFANVQDLVGRSDCLIQKRDKDLADLSELTQFTPFNCEKRVQTQILSSPLKEPLNSQNRCIGSKEASLFAKGVLKEPFERVYRASLAGNGFGAYNTEQETLIVLGGAGDGTAKSASGGLVAVLKENGLNGSVGKSFGYGATGGLLIAQGNADSRAGIRLSGADMIIGGALSGSAGMGANAGVNAIIKGFAFEYMTRGRGVVLGDPGPWICSGMTGGAVYLYQEDASGLTRELLKTRLAKGANVLLSGLNETGVQDLTDLLTRYAALLERFDPLENGRILNLLNNLPAHFLSVIPEGN